MGDAIAQDGSKVHLETLREALNDYVKLPTRLGDKAMRMPVSGLYNIKGVGTVVTGRIEQGIVKPGDEVCFLPTHTASNKCAGKVFSIEMHKKSHPHANPGDNVGLNMKGLVKENMPRSGDVMVKVSDTTLKPAGEFQATVQVLDIPNEIKTGYCPTMFVRCEGLSRLAVMEGNGVVMLGKCTGVVEKEDK